MDSFGKHCTLALSTGCLAVIQMCGSWVAFVGIRNKFFLYHFMVKTGNFRDKPIVGHFPKNDNCTLENFLRRLSENSTNRTVLRVGPTNTSIHDENYFRSAANVVGSYAWREKQTRMRESGERERIYQLSHLQFSDSLIYQFLDLPISRFANFPIC